MVHRGTISYTQGAGGRQAAADILLIPGGKATTLAYGTADWDTWDKAYFANNRARFLQSLQRLTPEAASSIPPAMGTQLTNATSGLAAGVL